MPNLSNTTKKALERISAVEVSHYPQAQTEDAMVVRELLADLQHVCHAKGYDFDGLLESAREWFDMEKEVP